MNKIFPLFSVCVFCAYCFNVEAFKFVTYRQSLLRPITHISSINSNDNPTTDSRILKSNIRKISATASKVLFGLASSVAILKSSPVSASGDAAQPIVIVGSRGRTGKLILDKLKAKGAAVRAATYNVDQNTDSAETIFADVKSVDSLITAVKGASTVIFAASASKKGGDAKAVDYLGVENIAKACVANKVPKLIIISSGAVTKPDSFGYKITNLFGRIMEYKAKGEESVRRIYGEANDPTLSYIIVRPGGLTDGSAIGARGIELNQGDTIIGEVHRDDVAECVVAAALSPTIPHDITFELYSIESGSPLQDKFPRKSGKERSGNVLDGSYDKMLEGLVSDSLL